MALGKWRDEIEVGGTERRKPGGCWWRHRKWKKEDVWKDGVVMQRWRRCVGRMLGKMAISGFWKNGGKRYLVGRWCFVDVKKVVGRGVRRRPAKPGGRELAG